MRTGLFATAVYGPESVAGLTIFQVTFTIGNIHQ